MSLFANKLDPTRIANAQSNLTKALAGDMAALAYMRSQVTGSATAVGRDAYRRAVATYDAQRSATPAPAAPPRLPVAIVPPPVVYTPPFLLPSPKFKPQEPLIYLTPTRFLDSANGSGITSPPSEPKPIGFNPVPPPMNHPPVAAPGGITVTGIAPGIITPVSIGSTDGGVITGPPSPEFSELSGNPSPVSAGFSNVAPLSVALAPASVTPRGELSAPTITTAKAILFLLAAAALFFFVDSKRK